MVGDMLAAVGAERSEALEALPGVALLLEAGAGDAPLHAAFAADDHLAPGDEFYAAPGLLATIELVRR